jgi:hypothetical protein
MTAQVVFAGLLLLLLLLLEGRGYVFTGRGEV